MFMYRVQFKFCFFSENLEIQHHERRVDYLQIVWKSIKIAFFLNIEKKKSHKKYNSQKISSFD